MDRKFVNNLKLTKEFLRKNKDLMCTNADKGNISIISRHVCINVFSFYLDPKINSM